jgi:hypothetical protein
MFIRGGYEEIRTDNRSLSVTLHDLFVSMSVESLFNGLSDK